MSQTEQTLSNVEFGYTFRLPITAPSGAAIAIEITEKNGSHKLHVETPDQHELYFEVTAYPGLLEHEYLVEDQQMFLMEASPSGWLSGEQQADFRGYFGMTFDFRGQLDGRWKERRFLFINTTTRTYRIVHDPTSACNVQVLETLELD